VTGRDCAWPVLSKVGVRCAPQRHAVKGGLGRQRRRLCASQVGARCALLVPTPYTTQSRSQRRTPHSRSAAAAAERADISRTLSPPGALLSPPQNIDNSTAAIRCTPQNRHTAAGHPGNQERGRSQPRRGQSPRPTLPPPARGRPERSSKSRRQVTPPRAVTNVTVEPAHQQPRALTEK